jgi:hypothetical protein
MLKYFNSIILIIVLSTFTRAQTPKAIIINEVEVEYRWMIWHAYVMDSAYLKVWLPNGDLPRRANGTFLYWKVDENGDLIPIRKIMLRLPIFYDNPPPRVEYKGNIYPWDPDSSNFVFPLR